MQKFLQVIFKNFLLTTKLQSSNIIIQTCRQNILWVQLYCLFICFFILALVPLISCSKIVTRLIKNLIFLSEILFRWPGLQLKTTEMWAQKLWQKHLKMIYRLLRSHVKRFRRTPAILMRENQIIWWKRWIFQRILSFTSINPTLPSRRTKNFLLRLLYHRSNCWIVKPYSTCFLLHLSSYSERERSENGQATLWPWNRWVQGPIGDNWVSGRKRFSWGGVF